jgi:hypothetical protein
MALPEILLHMISPVFKEILGRGIHLVKGISGMTAVVAARNKYEANFILMAGIEKFDISRGPYRP